MKRTILHFDLDAFYCAVEENEQPELRGKAFAVGGAADSRGVVSSASYAARVYGVRSAMPMAQARRLCPDLLVVPPRHGVYGEWSGRVMAILHNVTPSVEQISIDEAFLDVSGLRVSGEAIARQLQATIRKQLSLPCSLGVASNKLVAKIANNIGKANGERGQPPCAIEIVPEGQEADYLAGLPIRELWGVGPKTAEALHDLGIRAIGDIAAQSQDFMVHHFGKHGYELWQRARGIDARPVETEHEAKSISNETTFAVDERDGEELRRVLRNLAENVGRRLRKQGVGGRTIFIKLRWSDFTTLTRQTTLNHTAQDDRVITETALSLFEQHWPKGRPVRLIGVGASNLEEAAQQLSLWDAPQQQKQKRLQSALDELRDKFGDKAIRRGSNVESPEE